MGKPIKCRLVLHGSCNSINWGEFKSIRKARQYVKDCWDRPYTIIPLTEKK